MVKASTAADEEARAAAAAVAAKRGYLTDDSIFRYMVDKYLSD
jgi:hypothetical protein